MAGKELFRNTVEVTSAQTAVTQMIAVDTVIAETVILSSDLYIPAGVTLTINVSGALYCNNLTNDGLIINDGLLETVVDGYTVTAVAKESFRAISTTTYLATLPTLDRSVTLNKDTLGSTPNRSGKVLRKNNLEAYS